jgi:uncharacterized delta-60 repeat protein
MRRERSSLHPIESLERRVLFVLYGPDISFGNGGHATDVVAPANLVLTELPDGKILAVGSVLHNSIDEFRTETWVTRLNADGTLDRSFANGAGPLNVGEGSSAIFTGSRIYVIIEEGGEIDVDQILAYTPDGVLDTSFSEDGRDLVPFSHPPDSGGTINGHFLDTTDDGGVLLRVWSPFPGLEELVKLDADGAVDESFGDNGFINSPDETSTMSALWTSRGLIIVDSRIDGSGTEGGDSVRLTRYESDGRTLDTSFGDQGTREFPFLNGLTEDADGKLLFVAGPVGGTQPITRRLYRLNEDGSPDATFGDAGSVALDPAAATSNSGNVHIDADGRIFVVAGDKFYRFSAAGAREFVADLATFADGLFTLDSQDRLLRGTASGVTRFDELDPVAVGRDGKLYVHGDDGDDVVQAELIRFPAQAMIRLTLNGEVTEIDRADAPVGMVLNLAHGDNAATVFFDIATTVNTGHGADTITTGDGNDSISPGRGDNVITLGHGHDEVTITRDFTLPQPTNDHHQITGGNGNKQIRVDDGRTTIVLGTGVNTVHTTAVTDGNNNDHITIAGGYNDVTMYGDNDVLIIGGNGDNRVMVGLNEHADITTGAGNDFVHLMGPATVNTNAGDDSFVLQTQFDDGPVLLFAGDGNDRVAPYDAQLYSPNATIHGGNGNDYVVGGLSGQTIYGGAGNDTLWGGAGSDLISAGGGNDRIYGEGGNDRAYGGNGRDRIYGGNHDDRLHGGAQGDWLYGQHGSDVLRGDGGLDRLYADYASGVDTLHGGNGNDILISQDSLVDHLFGGRGDDTSIADDDEDVLSGIENRT